MTIRTSMVIVACLLSGCATWHKDGSTERDFKIDRGQCGAQAHSGGAVGFSATIAFEYCMEGKGWEKRH